MEKTKPRTQRDRRSGRDRRTSNDPHYKGP